MEIQHLYLIVPATNLHLQDFISDFLASHVDYPRLADKFAMIRQSLPLASDVIKSGVLEHLIQNWVLNEKINENHEWWIFHDFPMIFP